MNSKIAIVFGTRPEAIKLAPLVLALKADLRFDCRVWVTGQHRHMLDQVLQVFGITPDIDLNLMQANQSLGGLTSRAIAALDNCFAEGQPDLVLVQGDTTTVFCVALAAFYHKVPVGHVEAGLRTHDLKSPWPEEANRVLTSRLTSLHFAPTESAKQNLMRERVDEASIFVTGNTVVDALLWVRNKLGSSKGTTRRMLEELQLPNDFAQRFLNGAFQTPKATSARTPNGSGSESNVFYRSRVLAVDLSHGPPARILWAGIPGPLSRNPRVGRKASRCRRRLSRPP